MKTQTNSVFLKQTECGDALGAVEGRGSGKLEVNVIFTDARGTLAALKTAATLAKGLGTSIRLVALQAVPCSYPIDQPPVAVEFTEKMLSDLAARALGNHLEADVRLYLCRNRTHCLLQVLEPNSLVVIGGRKRWWPTMESKLAGTLQSGAHQVVFVALK